MRAELAVGSALLLALGCAHTTQTGKNADVVLWTADPFSVYARPEKVWVDGALLYDRTDPSEQWRTDFELGFVPFTATNR